MKMLNGAQKPRKNLLTQHSTAQSSTAEDGSAQHSTLSPHVRSPQIAPSPASSSASSNSSPGWTRTRLAGGSPSSSASSAARSMRGRGGKPCLDANATAFLESLELLSSPQKSCKHRHRPPGRNLCRKIQNSVYRNWEGHQVFLIHHGPEGQENNFA